MLKMSPKNMNSMEGCWNTFEQKIQEADFKIIKGSDEEILHRHSQSQSRAKRTEKRNLD
jgi:hypothetical protein